MTFQQPTTVDKHTFIEAEREKSISLLDEYAEQLKEIDLEFSQEYQEKFQRF